MKRLTLKELKISLPTIEVLEARTLFGGSGGYSDGPPPNYYENPERIDDDLHPDRDNIRFGEPDRDEPDRDEPGWWDGWDGNEPDRDNPSEQDDYEREDDRERPDPAYPNPEGGGADYGGQGIIVIDQAQLNNSGPISKMDDNIQNNLENVKQTYPNACVPSASAIIMNHYGIEVSQHYMMNQIINNPNITNSDSIYNVGKDGLFITQGLITSSQTEVLNEFFNNTHYDTSTMEMNKVLANVELQVTNNSPVFLSIINQGDTNLSNFEKIQNLEKQISNLQEQLNDENNVEDLENQLKELITKVNNTPVSAHQYIAIDVLYSPNGEVNGIVVIDPRDPEESKNLKLEEIGPIISLDVINGVNQNFIDNIERSNAEIERGNSKGNGSGDFIGPIG